MITCGWGTRVCSVVLFVAVSSSSLISTPITKAFDIKKVIDFGQQATDVIKDLGYFSAQELALEIPTFNQELVINWGFAGSGDLFSALPNAQSFLRNTKVAQYTNKPFNIADLGVLLAQDAIANTTKHHEMLSWFTDAQFSVFKVFCLKICLLAKDYHQGKFDFQTVQNELLRLITRLILSGDSEQNATPLSKRLPSFIKELVQPEVLSLLDTLWAMISTTAADTKTEARTVYVSQFKSEAAANLYFDTIKKTNNNLLKDGQGVVTFAAVTTSNVPNGMPEELHAAVMAADSLPQLIKVSTNKDQHHWIALVTSEQNFMTTTKSAIAALLDVLKQYAAVRKELLASNPAQARALAEQQQAAYQQMRLIQAFLKTDAGASSGKRLSDNIEAIKTKHQREEQERKQQIQTLETDIATLKTEETSLKERLVSLKAIAAGAKKPWLDEVQASIKSLKKEIIRVQEKLSGKENNLETLQPATQNNTQQSETLEQKEAQLAEFRTLEADLKKAGQPVPAEVKAQIKALETDLAAETNMPAAAQASLEQRLQERALKAGAYYTEAETIMQEIAEKHARINVLPIQRRPLAELKFSALERPQYTAYAHDLEHIAQDILNQNAQAEELYNYRRLLAETDAKLLPEATRAHIATLEAEIGWLVDGKSQTTWFVGTFFERNPELTELLKNLNDNDPAYAPVKQQLVERLSALVEQSTHIKEHAHVYGYFVGKFFPEFLPFFESIVHAAPVAH